MNDLDIKKLVDEIRQYLIEPKMTLTTDEVAHHLNTTRQHVDELRRSGRLRAVEKRRGYIYSRKEVERFVDQSTNGHYVQILLRNKRNKKSARD